MSAVMTREQLTEVVAKSDLSDPDVRRKLNDTVISEVVEARYKRQWWEVNGCAPINVSGTEYLRPVPRCVFGVDGWKVRMGAEWFCN